jgi:hypothetical protein
LKGEIRTSLRQSQLTLGQPGSPGYAYYRAHPTELAQALIQINSELHTFRAGHC